MERCCWMARCDGSGQGQVGTRTMTRAMGKRRHRCARANNSSTCLWPDAQSSCCRPATARSSSRARQARRRWSSVESRLTVAAMAWRQQPWWPVRGEALRSAGADGQREGAQGLAGVRRCACSAVGVWVAWCVQVAMTLPGRKDDGPVGVGGGWWTGRMAAGTGVARIVAR